MPKVAAKMFKGILTGASSSFPSEGAVGFEPPQAKACLADMHSASLGLSDTPPCC
jgi:hypothetical protein